MFSIKLLINFSILSLLPIFNNILGFVLKSDDNIRSDFDKKGNSIMSSIKRDRQMDGSLALRNRLNISVTTDWKSNDIEITGQKNGTVYLKNTYIRKLFISKGVSEKYRLDGRPIGEQLAKSEENDTSFAMRNRTPRLNQQFSGIPLSKTEEQPEEWTQIRNRFKRRAEKKKTNLEKKENNEKKEPSISDAFLEMASQTLKDGLRSGVKLWNKLKNQINEGVNNIKSNES